MDENYFRKSHFSTFTIWLRIGQVKCKETGKKFAAITQPRQLIKLRFRRLSIWKNSFRGCVIVEFDNTDIDLTLFCSSYGEDDLHYTHLHILLVAS